MLKTFINTRILLKSVSHWERSMVFHFSIMNNQLQPLISRLNEAEKRAKLLDLEVQSIRKEIRRLLETTKNSDQIHLKEESIDETDEESPKRFKGEFNKEKDYVVVYTDGACENNGKSNAKAGIGVWFGENHNLNISKPVNGRATNNTAEIQACIEALQVLKKHNVDKVIIKTDSEFTINCMTKWIQGWKKKNWKLASGGPVKNKIDLEKLDNLRMEFSDVKFEHIKAHVGILGNERADQLAREGAIRYTY